MWTGLRFQGDPEHRTVPVYPASVLCGLQPDLAGRFCGDRPVAAGVKRRRDGRTLRIVRQGRGARIPSRAYGRRLPGLFGTGRPVPAQVYAGVRTWYLSTPMRSTRRSKPACPRRWRKRRWRKTRVGVEPHCERVAFLGGLFQALDGAVGLAQSQPACGKLTGGNIAPFRRSAQPGKTAAGDIRLSAQTRKQRSQSPGDRPLN